MRVPRAAATAFALLVAVPLVAGARAAELSNLDSGLPNTLDDALAVAPGRVELQGAVRYDRLPGGRDAVRLLPRVQVGIVEGLQANIGLPYVAGSGRRVDPADPVAGVLYNINRERDWLPAFAVSADVTTRIGVRGRGAETGLTAIATKTITPAVDRRLHLNVSWLRALDPGREDRRDRYRVIAGYSQLVSPSLVVVLDYIRESQEERERRDANLVEAGLRYRYNEAITLGAGAGFGIGRDSPRFRAIASIQIGFGGR